MATPGVTMAKNLKPYEVPLEADLAREVLNIPLQNGVTPASPRTIGERVSEAIRSVEAANEHLAESKLAAMVADTLMRQLKKRGTPSIRVRPDGIVILHVSYEEDERHTKPEAPVKKRSRKSTLPTLDALRKRAKEMGVDISDLGRMRKAIHKRLEDAAKHAHAEDDGAFPPEPTPKPDDRRVIRRPAKKSVAEAEELDMDEFLDGT